jgi:hypothetical protein
MMDEDLDFMFTPSQIIYGCRAIRIDPSVGAGNLVQGGSSTPSGGCFLGNLNGMCVGVSAQQSEYAPGLIGTSGPPFPLGQPQTDSTYPYAPGGSGALIPVYGPNRRCLIDVDPAFGGRIAPNTLIISSNSGYAIPASPYGSYNQWIIGIALSFASAGQSLNLKVQVFPWLPTGS